ncbi:MAG: DUF3846 domain-containing protein [Provencibacterium sp.]|nr:DUF3846 domain-containing protein [Provencibacterium sp.]
MPKEIDVLIVEPGKAPRPAKVQNTLEAFGEIVGGPIEAGCYLPQRVLLVCQENAKGLGLPPNRANPRARDYIAGTFLLCGFEGDAFTSLTPAQQVEFQTYFGEPGEFMLIGTETVCAAPGELALNACKLWERMKNGESVVLTKWGGPGEGQPE